MKYLSSVFTVPDVMAWFFWFIVGIRLIKEASFALAHVANLLPCLTLQIFI